MSIFKIETNVPFTGGGRKDTIKQALYNTVALMKPNDSIFVHPQHLSKGSAYTYFKEVIKAAFSQKNLVCKYASIKEGEGKDEKEIKGVRIFCNPAKPVV